MTAMHDASADPLLEPATLMRLGIQQQPFEAPHEDELFIDESLELQVQMLRHNLRYSNMLQVLCGRPGAGKTTLTISLIRVVNKELELFLVRGEKGLTSSRIFADLLRALDHESTADSATDVQTFIRELAQVSEADTPAALVVDDAHMLERRELELLLANTVQIDDSVGSGFRLLLVGQPSLRDKLDAIDSPLLQPGRVYSAELKPFSVEQTGAYLAHRLRAVGASWPFDDEEVASIAESAEGLPGAIDRVAATALNHRYASTAIDTDADDEPVLQTTSSRPGLVRGLAAGAVVALAVIWTLWPEDSPDPDTPLQPLALPEPPTVTPAQPLFKDETVAEPTQAVEEIPPPAQPVETPDDPAPGTDEATQTAPEPTAQPAVASVVEAPAPVEAEPPEREVAAAPPPQPAAPAERPRDSAWLRNQRKDHYMVQLMAARDPQVLDQFIREHALGAEAAVFPTRRKGATWHVLLYGLYANADTARASIAELPSGLRKHSPWIRSVASVQQALLEAPP